MITENAVTMLKLHGIKMSAQRLVIYSYLDEKRNHPTVDTIYNDLRNDYPMLSKTTIYNTLKLFAEKGIIQSLIVEDGELRFDANITFHAHFKCNKCNLVYDIQIADSSLLPEITDDFQITETHINYRGLCKNCQ